MKVKFEDPRFDDGAGGFLLQLNSVPRAGEDVWVDKDIVPQAYFDRPYLVNGPMFQASLVRAHVVYVAHLVTKTNHTAEVRVEIGDYTSNQE